MVVNVTVVEVGQEDYLAGLVELLWPSTGGLDSATDPGSRNLGMVALPSRRNPRLVVPKRPRVAAAAAFQNFKASASSLEMLRGRAMALGARAGLLDLLPGGVPGKRSVNGIDRHLSELLGRSVVVALYIGPPRAVQKPVLQIIDESGSTVAFAKLGTNDLTRALIRTEAQTLQTLANVRMKSLVTPSLLSSTTWNDAQLIVQSAVSPGKSALRLRRTLAAATMEVARCLKTSLGPWVGSEYRSRLLKRLLALPQNDHADLLRSAVSWLDAALGETNLEFGSWHGDWAPWNMTTRGGQVIAWDWEHFQSGVPVGLDAVHFDVAESLMNPRESPVNAFTVVLRDRRRGLVSETVDPGGRAALVTQYVIELAIRYIRDGEVKVGGTRMSRLDAWLPTVLGDCSRALAVRG